MNLGMRLKRKSASAGSKAAPGSDEEKKTKAELVKQAGQIVALFGLMLLVVIGFVGIAVDVTYAWREELRIQKAADAAALAGVVYLPGNVSGGTTAALAEAGKNGFSGGVAAAPDGTNTRQMNVSITTPVPTFFLRALGVNSFTVTRSAKAVYILPVPMGSPDPYYGVFGTIWKKTPAGSVSLAGPHGQAIAARGLWGSMLSSGAAAQNGDAFLPRYNASAPNGTNPQRDATNYYDYAIYMPPGSSGGHVYIYDAAFCDTGMDTPLQRAYGTGDSWYSGNGKVDAHFTLYNTNNQPYNPPTHTWLGSSGSLFTNMAAYDTAYGGSNPPGGAVACTSTDPNDYRYWHMKWFDLSASIGGAGIMSGGATGTTYRLHTSTYPPVGSNNGDGNNSFAIYVEASGGTAQVYGVGAMQMYTPLVGGQNSTFYLAQIDAQAGAGKTVQIKLWDPGDTGQLTAVLRILQPTASGWSAVTNMTWTAQRVTSGAANCVGGSGGSITTNQSGTSRFQGCWLTISIVLPTTYSAPQDGWWKIQYTMTGSGISSDQTTWLVDIRGNPVHLIP